MQIPFDAFSLPALVTETNNEIQGRASSPHSSISVTFQIVIVYSCLLHWVLVLVTRFMTDYEPILWISTEFRSRTMRFSPEREGEPVASLFGKSSKKGTNFN